MAVEKQRSRKSKATQPQLVKDFWPRFKRNSVALIVLLQLFILIALAALLKTTGFFDSDPLGFTATLIAQRNGE